MHRPALATALAILIAGCVTPPAAGPEDDPTTDGPTMLVYGDCDELLGAFPVQEGAVAVPEGFTPAPFIGQGNSAIFIVGWQCATARDDANATEEAPFVEASVGYAVTPPAELELEGAFAHAILLGLTTASPLGLAAYEAWGIPAVEGDVAFTWNAAPVGGSGTLSGAVGPLDVGMRVSAGGPPSPEAGSAVRFFAVEGGALVAAYDITWVGADGFGGQALSTEALPGAPPATTGLGFWYTSDAADRYTMTSFALPNGTA